MTEHEYKYVLFNSQEVQHLFTSSHDRVENIEQGYIVYSKGTTARIRKTTTKKTNWFFTFKQKVDTRTIELEQKINNRDGEELWKRCIGKLRKKRFIIFDEEKWEIDFFFDQQDNIYFIMAEVELPEGSGRPNLPSFIDNSLLYTVPLNDSRFSNKMLGDVGYTKNLYKQLQREAIHVA